MRIYNIINELLIFKNKKWGNKVKNIRNVAIIAHVDHGKTTLVDSLLKESGIFRENEQISDRVMDSGDIEKERGITILSKNTAIKYNDIKINIVDTPGHADFGGEVERVLKMVDGVILVVDAFDGPMPQTRFVLSKALDLDLIPIVVINKIDRPGARAEEVEDEVLELFMELNATDEQLDFKVIYASGKNRFAKKLLSDESIDMRPLFETIIDVVPEPKGNENSPLQLLISNIDYDEYTGRIGIGKIENGVINKGDQVALCKKDGEIKNIKIGKLCTYAGLKRIEVDSAVCGDIVAVTGLESINIGETIADINNPVAVDFIDIDEPTVSMTFIVNNGPFAGKDGKFITSRHLRERLFKELETNVSLRVEETNSSDSFKVFGRGELHLSILIENMRREGFEVMVSKPEVVHKIIDGVKCEPMEIATIDVPEEYIGNVMEKIGNRKGEMINMSSSPSQVGYTRLEFKIPARGLIGYRGEFMTDTKGTGVMNHIFAGYEKDKGELVTRTRGVIIAHEKGKSTAYGLYNAQERATLLIGAGEEVYVGMIVGENSRSEDMVVNVCKEKNLTNMRASGSDDSLKLVPHKILSLEQAIEFIGDDELVEITPNHIRLRKKILDPTQRLRESRK
ncbi:MAG: translational GTPase TypA [Clostridia bacterium]|nr:translational GTPase TypA [Clostridia bacterium]MDD4375263.1 translational GTPase TypA [Clostridia bacterium]